MRIHLIYSLVSCGCYYGSSPFHSSSCWLTWRQTFSLFLSTSHLPAANRKRLSQTEKQGRPGGPSKNVKNQKIGLMVVDGENGRWEFPGTAFDFIFIVDISVMSCKNFPRSKLKFADQWIHEYNYPNGLDRWNWGTCVQRQKDYPEPDR